MAGIHQNLFVSPGFYFDAILAADTANYNVHDAVVAAGWDGVQPVFATVKVNTGVTIGSSSTAIASFVRGAFPAASIIKLQVDGAIIGRGGDGGTGGNGQGIAGHSGGPALDASDGPLQVESNGIIAGGGGGGAGGSSTYNSVQSGGGGGGGRGSLGGGGGGRGTGQQQNGTVGTAATSDRGGYGGRGGEIGGAGPIGGIGGSTVAGTPGATGDSDSAGGGGGGGGFGSPGGNGGTTDYYPSAPIGGAPGAAVIGNANITWLASGSRYGSLS